MLLLHHKTLKSSQNIQGFALIRSVLFMIQILFMIGFFSYLICIKKLDHEVVIHSAQNYKNSCP